MLVLAGAADKSDEIEIIKRRIEIYPQPTAVIENNHWVPLNSAAFNPSGRALLPLGKSKQRQRQQLQ
jgi:hypothetical protein